jgi:hypothetical protein
MSISFSSAYEPFLPYTFVVFQGLLGCSAFADFSLADMFIFLVIDPFVQIAWLLRISAALIGVFVILSLA